MTTPGPAASSEPAETAPSEGEALSTDAASRAQEISPIVLQQVTVTHDTAGGTVTSLQDVSLRTRARSIAVVGLNGSGKSTFARVVAGLRKPAAGTVTVGGVDMATRHRRRAGVGFVFTDPDAQIVMPTVGEDLAFSLRGSGLSKTQIAERVDRVLVENNLAGRADTPAHDLSGGQKQMLAIHAVLASDPRLVIADEPTTLLDARNARRISAALLNSGRQTIIVTHDLQLAQRCEAAILFDRSRLLAQGEPQQVISRYLEEVVDT